MSKIKSGKNLNFGGLWTVDDYLQLNKTHYELLARLRIII